MRIADTLSSMQAQTFGVLHLNGLTLTGPCSTYEVSCCYTVQLHKHLTRHNLLACLLGGAALILWLLGVMLPFYGTINSFMGAIGVPTTAFVLPAIAFTWHFRKRETRDAAIYPPHRCRVKCERKGGANTYNAALAHMA